MAGPGLGLAELSIPLALYLNLHLISGPKRQTWGVYVYSEESLALFVHFLNMTTVNESLFSNFQHFFNWLIEDQQQGPVLGFSTSENFMVALRWLGIASASSLAETNTRWKKTTLSRIQSVSIKSDTHKK